MLSSSSDFTAKVWNIPDFDGTGEFIDEYESETEYLVAVLNHPSYVYSGKFHPRKRKAENLVIATACFDAKVRIWYVKDSDRGFIPKSIFICFLIKY